MRLDVYMKLTRLAVSRTAAQELCDSGLVTANGTFAKPSKDVKAGDVLIIRSRNRTVTLRVDLIPKKKQVTKSEAAVHYTILSNVGVDDGLP